ncbi:MAG: hypothetical protein ABEK16_06310 [Candidatus Nanohalobium sp.]
MSSEIWYEAFKQAHVAEIMAPNPLTAKTVNADRAAFKMWQSGMYTTREVQLVIFSKGVSSRGEILKILNV